jgi:excisionase family DNA binding protein
MSDERVPLFVRLPAGQAAALDRLVEGKGMHKQQVVSDLLGERLEVGRLDIHEPRGGEEVLTLEELAELLRLEPAEVLASARAGDIPGRRFGEEWRFARAAVIEWLARGEPADAGGGDREAERVRAGDG